MLVKGSVRERGSAGGGGGEVGLAVEEIRALAPAAVGPLLAIELVLASKTPQGKLLELKNLLLEHHGEVPVTLELDLSEGSVTIAPSGSFKVAYGRDLAGAVETLLGPRPPPRAPHRGAHRDVSGHPLHPRCHSPPLSSPF